jgi:hypothetical protein
LVLNLDTISRTFRQRGIRRLRTGSGDTFTCARMEVLLLRTARVRSGMASTLDTTSSSLPCLLLLSVSVWLGRRFLLTFRQVTTVCTLSRASLAALSYSTTTFFPFKSSRTRGEFVLGTASTTLGMSDVLFGSLLVICYRRQEGRRRKMMITRLVLLVLVAVVKLVLGGRVSHPRARERRRLLRHTAIAMVA